MSTITEKPITEPAAQSVRSTAARFDWREYAEAGDGLELVHVTFTGRALNIGGATISGLDLKPGMAEYRAGFDVRPHFPTGVVYVARLSNDGKKRTIVVVPMQDVLLTYEQAL